MDTRVWELAEDSNKDKVIRTDLRYFRTHFVGEPMADTWEVPELDVQGKRKRVRDFVSWEASAPVISERARKVLEPLIGDHVEFLPLVVLKRQQYYAINVLTLVDCLDWDRSEVQFGSPDTSRIVMVWKASFDPKRVADVPIFKLPQYRGATFVRRPFIDAVVEAGLQGAYFVDPFDPMRYVFRKEPDMIDRLTGPEYREGTGTVEEEGSGQASRSEEDAAEALPPAREERPLDQEEKNELAYFAHQGLVRLGLLGRAASPEDIVCVVSQYLDRWRKEHRNPSEDDVLVFALECSVLWASQVVRTLGWEWVAVLEEGEPLYAIASPDRSRVVYPVVWFGDLARDRHLENNLVLTFNLLRSGKLPPARPGEYREVR